MLRYRRVLLGLPVLLFALQVSAHHSSAMFDDQKSTTLSGTVKAYQWTNPHCWIQLLVPSKAGPVEWSVQMGSPAQLFRVGWRPATVKAGDKISLVVHPMRDGTNAGLFASGIGADGKSLGNRP